MKVILKQDIKGVGKKDQVINAADGYARNYLFPKNLAVPADQGNMNNLKAKNESVAYRKGEDKKEAEEIAKRLKDITVKIRVKAGENGRLFGAVTSKEISEALKKDYNIDVDKKKVLLQESIKAAGVTIVDLKLNEGVMAKVIQFFKESRAELKKVVWPTKDDVISSINVNPISYGEQSYLEGNHDLSFSAAVVQKVNDEPAITSWNLLNNN